MDAIHLARFATKKIARAAFDLGAGAGAVGLTLLELRGAARVTFVEIDSEACAFCSKNIADRAIHDSTRVVEGDVLEAAEANRGRADLVVCNPPYVEPGAGRAPLEPRRARARQGSLEHFVKAARLLVARRGRACFVYPA
ncbi:MAG: methyltransferase, partial [Polyangiaceae bacterium]